ncbi:hypothetical protein GWI33_007008 [Rhynchophorus ferrugineus]|uniref:Uncharacterized protein n=1 Tax=Rhynchophorus ferrugineus TaxID=354439 RepID=A0A834MIL8_RHYFE|nr:hypothetical protein GWI33_007008 [Rhynchophorus ferrugineus]
MSVKRNDAEKRSNGGQAGTLVNKTNANRLSKPDSTDFGCFPRVRNIVIITEEVVSTRLTCRLGFSQAAACLIADKRR